MDKPDILMVAYYFDCLAAIGAVRPHRFCQYLRQLGYRCTVITAVPGQTFDSNVIHVRDVPGEIWNDMDRASGGAVHSRSLEVALEKLVRKIFLPGHIGFGWSQAASVAARSLVKGMGKGRPVVFSSYPPVGAHLAGLLISARHRLPWIADFRDPMAAEPGLLRASWRKRASLSLLEKMVFRRASAIVANTEAAAAKWRQTYPETHHKLHVIWNGFDPQEEIRPEPLPPSDQNSIVHAGSLYGARNADLILQTLARLRAKGEPAAASARVLLVGYLDPASRMNAAMYDAGVREGWLELLPPVPKEEAQRLICQAGGLLLLQPQSAIQVPGKLFEYISIGRRILAVAPPESAIEWILARSGIPYVCLYPGDSPDTAERKMVEFLNLPSRSVEASAWYRSNFDARLQARQLAAIVDSIAAWRPADSAERSPESLVK
jgi:glycosyltransferase involved in cell wall biosynthesis